MVAPNLNYSTKKALNLERFIAKRIEGHSFQSIARTLGVSKSTLIEWNKDCRTRDAIEQGRLFRLNEIVKAHRMDLQTRLSHYLNLSQRLHEEIAGRDLREVSTERLLWMSVTNDERVRKMLCELGLVGTVGVNPYLAPIGEGQSGFFSFRLDE